jgi:hypothetical protein
MTYNSLREKISAEKAEREARYSGFEQAFAEAWQAGVDAANALVPRPMVVTTETGQIVDVVSEGLCGFAWVNVPGNTSFGRWLRKRGLARPDYPSGLAIWISAYSQSYERKTAHAMAMVAFLKGRGIEARAGSRLD